MRKNIWVVVLIILVLTGCNFPKNIQSTPAAAALTVTEEPIPTVENTATLPPTPVIELPLFSMQEVYEKNETPKYEINLTYPFIENQLPDAETFNNLIETTLKGQIPMLINSAAETEEWRAENLPESFSSLQDSYEILYADSNTISILFSMSSYIAGAAHPFPYFITINYDLQQGRKLELSDLFQSGSDYLGQISSYCIDELQSREDVFSDTLNDGAGPQLENYMNWNIQEDGLRITFDVYQVAPYAAGPITVLIPYAALQDILQPDGPAEGVNP